MGKTGRGVAYSVSSQKWFSQYPALGPGSRRRGSDRGAKTNRFRVHSVPYAKAIKEASNSFGVTVKRQRTSSAIVNEEHQNHR